VKKVLLIPLILIFTLLYGLYRGIGINLTVLSVLIKTLNPDFNFKTTLEVGEVK